MNAPDESLASEILGHIVHGYMMETEFLHSDIAKHSTWRGDYHLDRRKSVLLIITQLRSSDTHRAQIKRLLNDQFVSWAAYYRNRTPNWRAK
jgi:hypothetical protein